MAYNPAQPFADRQGGASPYDYLRNKATQEAGTEQNQNLDAITRRYAAMGNLNSGAYTQAVTDANRQSQQNLQDRQGQIDLSENAQALPYAQMQQQFGEYQQGLQEQQAARAQQATQFGQGQQQQMAEFQAEMPLKSRQLDLEASQQNLDKQANEINASLGSYQEQHSGGLFGGGGFLGTGIGGGK